MKRIHHNTGWKIRRMLGIRRNHCAAIAAASALADNPRDVYEVADLVPGVIEKLKATGQFDYKGTWFGGHSIAGVVGLDDADYQREDRDRSKGGVVDHYDYWTGHYSQVRTRVQLPTMVQWIRRNPDVKRAIVRCTRHLGFFERKNGVAHVFNISARKRVDYALVLERYSDEDVIQPAATEKVPNTTVRAYSGPVKWCHGRVGGGKRIHAIGYAKNQDRALCNIGVEHDQLVRDVHVDGEGLEPVNCKICNQILGRTNR